MNGMLRLTATPIDQQRPKQGLHQGINMSMSKFASQADYWKDRAERAEAKLAELERQEPVVKYSDKRLTP